MTDVRSLGLPVRRWVPDWLALASVFIVILPVLMVNGSYTGSMLEVSNTLGTNTEDITMGYYATSAGFAIGYPIVPKVLSAIPEKMMLVVNLTLQFLLSWVCARSQNVDILIVASFVIGFLKGFMMLWFIRMARFIFSPKDVRSEFYSYFFPLAFGFGQLSMVLTAELAYHYNWKYMYYFMMILMLISILTVIVCYRQDKKAEKIPLSEFHFREMMVAAGFLHLVAEDGGEAFRQFGSSVSAESRGGLFLHDADDVLQYLHHVAHQLHDHYLAGRFHTYLPCLYMGASGLCIGCVHLLLVVPLAEVAFPFFGGRSNGVFCRVLRHSLFHYFARKHV